MRDLIFKKKFSKDVERIKRTGRDMSRLAEVIDLLAEGRPMPLNNRDHQLAGNFKDSQCRLPAPFRCPPGVPEAAKTPVLTPRTPVSGRSRLRPAPDPQGREIHPTPWPPTGCGGSHQSLIPSM